MLGREERKQRNIEFWDSFRKKMRPVQSSNGRKMNWSTYPSDVKDIYIRIEVDGSGVRLCMDIQPKDEGVRSILWEQMTELKKVLEQNMNWETCWVELFKTSEGQLRSRIMWENPNLNFYNNDDWDEIMQFLKDRLVEFDSFYQEFKDILISLAE